jgi:hypothetical protein
VKRENSKKSSRRKLYVAYLKGEVAGMSNGYTDAEAKRLFAAERRVPPTAVEVKWTGLKEVSLAEYHTACEKQIDYLV